MKPLSPHISFAQIADLAENGAVIQADTRRHLDNCTRCGSEFTKLSGLFDLMRTDKTEDAPRDVMFSVIGMFRAHRAAQPSLLRRVLGALSFDSAQLTPAYGLRSGAASATRQILYSADGYDIDLRITAEGKLSGQILGDDCDGGSAELAGASVVTAQLNDVCEFTLPAVAPGKYALRLRLASLEIEIPDLEL